MYNITHFFEIEGNKYAFDFRNLIFSLMDNNTYCALKEMIEINVAQYIPSPDYYTLNALTKSGYFATDKPENTIQKPDYDTLNISFAPIHDCNFSCKYCYANGGEATTNYKSQFNEHQIDNLLDYVYIKKYSYYKNYKFDFVSGGEPLLNFSILEYFLKNMRYISELHKKQTSVLIVTNGTLLTEQIISQLDKYDVFLGISIDGSEQIHDRHRVYKGGSGTYRDVVNGISLLRKSKASSKIKDAWAMTVVARDTGSLVDAMETCENLGFKRMQMQLLRAPRCHPLSIRNADIAELKGHYVNLFNHIISHVKRGDLSRLKMIANDNDSFGKFLRRLLLRNTVYYRCFAGKNKIAITAKGEVYPCDSFCGEKDFCMDKLDNKTPNNIVETMFQQAHFQNRLICSKCWARQICGGDCFYNSYMINGNIYDPDPVVCEMNRFFIEHAIALLLNIQIIDPNHITYLARFLDQR